MAVLSYELKDEIYIIKSQRCLREKGQWAQEPRDSKPTDTVKEWRDGYSWTVGDEDLKMRVESVVTQKCTKTKTG